MAMAWMHSTVSEATDSTALPDVIVYPVMAPAMEWEGYHPGQYHDSITRHAA
jgi:hypothetical protein